MRRSYLVCYDIVEPARLRRVYKIMQGYGQHWQLSVFFCVLKDIDRVRLQVDLEEKMNKKEDQLIIIDLGPDVQKARAMVTVIGPALPPDISSGVVVI